MYDSRNYDIPFRTEKRRINRGCKYCPYMNWIYLFIVRSRLHIIRYINGLIVIRHTLYEPKNYLRIEHLLIKLTLHCHLFRNLLRCNDPKSNLKKRTIRISLSFHAYETQYFPLGINTFRSCCFRLITYFVQ